jgi:hypothetical protein
VRAVRLLICNSVMQLEPPAGESLIALRSQQTLAAQEMSTLDSDFHTRFVGWRSVPWANEVAQSKTREP